MRDLRTRIILARCVPISHAERAGPDYHVEACPESGDLARNPKASS